MYYYYISYTVIKLNFLCQNINKWWPYIINLTSYKINLQYFQHPDVVYIDIRSCVSPIGEQIWTNYSFWLARAKEGKKRTQFKSDKKSRGLLLSGQWPHLRENILDLENTGNYTQSTLKCNINNRLTVHSLVQKSGLHNNYISMDSFNCL